MLFIKCSLTNTVLPIWSVFIAFQAETLEDARSIDTMSVPAHLTLQSAALINIYIEIIWTQSGLTIPSSDNDIKHMSSNIILLKAF